MSYYTMREVEGHNGSRFVSEDGRLTVLLSVTEHDRGDRHDLMNIWIREGLYEGEFLDSTLNVSVEYVDDEGVALGIYNPTVCVTGSRPGRALNFSRLLEDTPENRRTIVAECAAMYRDGIRYYRGQERTSCTVTTDCLAAA